MLKWMMMFGLLAIAGPLSAETKVLAFAGSTRKDSCNKKLINNAAEIARNMGAEVKVIDLKDYPIPLYDADDEKSKGMPENAKRLRKLMLESNRIIVSTPEYNGSLPAVLKNAIDWASRSEDGKPSREAFLGNKFAILSCSPGGGGGALALNHLRAVIKNIGGDVIALQVAVPNCYSIFNAQGILENDEIKKQIKEEMQQLLQ